MVAYVPDAGDIVWLNFTPQRGHEQAGRRPAVVLSPKGYNQRTDQGLSLRGCAWRRRGYGRGLGGPGQESGLASPAGRV